MAAAAAEVQKTVEVLQCHQETVQQLRGDDSTRLMIDNTAPQPQKCLVRDGERDHHVAHSLYLG